MLSGMIHMKTLSAIVLCGGKGTRIKDLYPDTPKPLVAAAGQPFLHWVSHWLIGQGIGHLVLSVGYQAEMIADWVAQSEWPEGIRVETCLETVPLGTGGGALNCLDMAGDPILVLNGDSLLVTSIAPLFEALEDETIDAAILGNSVSDTSRYGSLDIDKKGNLNGFHEKRPGTGFINAGVYLFKRHVLDSFPRGQPLSMEYDILPQLLSKGARIHVHTVMKAAFLDIGTPETVTQATQFIEANLEELKNSGVG